MKGLGDTYIFLEILLLFIITCCGFGISKCKKHQFWIFAILAILSYSLIQGLRYDRGPDYMWYKFQYEHFKIVDQDIGFTFINQILNILHIPYYGAFIFYSFLLILSVIILLKNNREIAIYALPIFFITINLWAEAMIRQYVGLSFTILSFSYLLRGKLWKFYIFILIGALVHASTLVIFPFFLLFYYIKIPIKSPYIFIILYLIISFVWKISYWGDYAMLLNGLDVGHEKFNQYTSNAEHWFTEDNSTGYVMSKALFLRQLLSRIILIYFGIKLLNKVHNFQIPFFLFFISIIILHMGGDIEVIHRIGCSFNIFEFFVAAMVLYKTKRNNLFVKGAMLFLIINYTYGFIAGILYRVDIRSYKFIWDATMY